MENKILSSGAVDSGELANLFTRLSAIVRKLESEGIRDWSIMLEKHDQHDSFASYLVLKTCDDDPEVVIRTRGI